MKTHLIFLGLIFFVSSQLVPQEETLVGDGEVSHGGFGGPVVKFTQIMNEPAVLVGGRGGWIINHTFVIGGGGYGLTNKIEAVNHIPGIKPYLNFGYGGVELEYIIHSDKLLHFTIYTLIGGGSVSYREDLWDDSWSDPGSPEDAFFIAEPAVNVEINIISFFRINAGASYRFISGTEFDDLKNKDIAGVSAVLTFKFGTF